MSNSGIHFTGIQKNVCKELQGEVRKTMYLCLWRKPKPAELVELETRWMEAPEMQHAVGLAGSDARWSTCPHLFVHPYTLARSVTSAKSHSWEGDVMERQWQPSQPGQGLARPGRGPCVFHVFVSGGEMASTAWGQQGGHKGKSAPSRGYLFKLNKHKCGRETPRVFRVLRIHRAHYSQNQPGHPLSILLRL